MIPTRRRLLGSTLALIALAASAPRIASAQARSVRIGFLAPRQASNVLPPVLKRLAELGYVEGKNLVVDYRSAEGVAERFPSLARDLIRAKSDLIFAIGTEHSARALLEAKTDIPIVIVAIDYDPVKSGIVSNLRRPGGNVTGVLLSSLALAAKRLELLRETVPKAKRFLALADHFTKDQIESIRHAAEQLRVEIVVETFAAPPYDFESAFVKGRAARVEGVILPSSPVFADNRARIAAQVMKHKLPSVGFLSTTEGAELLIEYDVDRPKTYARGGDIAASILKGAKPGDSAIEQPTEYVLVVNLKMAKTLGISIPQSILVRANRVIE